MMALEEVVSDLGKGSYYYPLWGLDLHRKKRLMNLENPGGIPWQYSREGPQKTIGGYVVIWIYGWMVL